ncbi:MAG: hypothetical protein IPL25_10665 [Saprospiraceae bacterium]|nr:hypothetical protein [Candidatus Vicinibacter affinis]
MPDRSLLLYFSISLLSVKDVSIWKQLGGKGKQLLYVSRENKEGSNFLIMSDTLLIRLPFNLTSGWNLRL